MILRWIEELRKERGKNDIKTAFHTICSTVGRAYF